MRELAKNEHFDWPIAKRVLRTFVPYWRRAVIVGIVLLLTSVGGAMPAWLTQRMIDVGIAGPNIVLLDEATSALDTLVEREIQEALGVLLEGRSALVIAHRLSTILSADKIVVMNDGQIVAEGNHQTLLEESSLYRELYEAQFGVAERGERVS